MFKQSILGLALGLALAGAAGASPMTDGEVRLLNFSLSPGPGGTYMTLGSFGYGSGHMMIRFFGGLNLTGIDLGEFKLLDDNTSGWHFLPDVLDGVFSVQVTATNEPSLGDDNGVVTAWIYNTQFDELASGASTVATDARPPAVSGVPEPGSLLLAATAGLALTALRRRA